MDMNIEVETSKAEVSEGGEEGKKKKKKFFFLALLKCMQKLKAKKGF